MPTVLHLEQGMNFLLKLNICFSTAFVAFAAYAFKVDHHYISFDSVASQLSTRVRHRADFKQA